MEGGCGACVYVLRGSIGVAVGSAHRSRGGWERKVAVGTGVDNFRYFRRVGWSYCMVTWYVGRLSRVVSV